MRTEGAKILWTKNPPMRNKTARSRSRFAWTHSAQNSKQLNSLLRPLPTARVMTTKVPGRLKIPGSDNNTSSVSRAARSRRGRSSGKRVWALPAMRSALANRHYITPLPRMSAPFVPRLLGCGNGGGFRSSPIFSLKKYHPGPILSHPIRCVLFGLCHPSQRGPDKQTFLVRGRSGRRSRTRTTHGVEPSRPNLHDRACRSSLCTFSWRDITGSSREKKVIHKCPLQKYRGRNPVFTPTT